MMLPELLDNGIIERIGWALVHTIWQGALIAGVLAITLRFGRGALVRTRYGLSVASLVALFMAAVVTVAMQPQRAPRAVRVSGAGAMPIDENAPTASVVSESTIPTPRTTWSADRALPWLVAGWSAGVLALSLWQFGGWLMLRQYRSTASAVEALWQERLRRLADRMGVRRAAMLMTERLEIPIVIGALRPAILMPAAILAGLSVQQIEAILAHELAHIRRHDYLVNLIQAAIETLLFYHPAVWWIGKQIRREREFCCDELAAEACGNRTVYARALAALEESRGVRLAPAAGGRGRGELLMRVRRILGHNEAPPMIERRAQSWVASSILILLCVSLPLSSRWLAAQNRPATHPNGAPPALGIIGTPAENDPSKITPEDFVSAPADYRIGANDMIRVSIADLVPGQPEWNKTSRVTQSGKVSLPLIGEVVASGLTEGEFEHLIRKTYRDINLLRDARASVVVTEARGRLFSILGAVAKPGEYEILDSDFRLFNALVLAGGGTKGDVRIVRRLEGGKQRVIDIPAKSIAAGDPAVNIVIRPKDYVVALETTARVNTGEYYIGGFVKRTGVYSLTARTIRLKQAIIAAGFIEGLKDPAELHDHPFYVTIVRRVDGVESFPLNHAPLSNIFDNQAPDLVLMADDQIMIGDKSLTDEIAATQPRN